MNKSKLVHITSSLQRGGAELVLSRIVRGLCTAFDQTVIYIHDGPQRAEIESYGVQCIQITGAMQTYDPFFFYRLYVLIKQLSPDLMHTLLWAATVSGRCIGTMLSVPVVSMYHGNVDQDGWVRNFCDRITFSSSTINGAVSPGVADSLRLLTSRPSAHIIPNGIASEYQKSFVSRSDLGISSHAYLIGAVGRLVGIKCFDILIDAYAQLQFQYADMCLCIIGTGPELDALKKRVDHYGLQAKVYFLGGVQAVDYYHLFDAFVLPSPREGISMALLEAMRAQLPCIVVSDSEHPVITHNKNGIVIDRAQVPLLVDAIEDLYRNTTLAQQLAQAGKETVHRDFSENAMIASYKKLFRSVISRSA